MYKVFKGRLLKGGKRSLIDNFSMPKDYFSVKFLSGGFITHIMSLFERELPNKSKMGDYGYFILSKLYEGQNKWPRNFNKGE